MPHTRGQPACGGGTWAGQLSIDRCATGLMQPALITLTLSTVGFESDVRGGWLVQLDLTLIAEVRPVFDRTVAKGLLGCCRAAACGKPWPEFHQFRAWMRDKRMAYMLQPGASALQKST